MGKVLSFLFGTLSTEDLDSIRRNVNALAQNQQKITHVLQESLSILNMSRIEIAENRKSINELLHAFAELNEDFRNVTVIFNERIFNLDRHVAMNSIIEGLSRLITEARFYIEHLQMQLNMLTLGHLSPSVISPKNLRSLLLGIASELPPGILLPSDPTTELWNYYKILSCHTLLDTNRILIVMSIPLLDYDSNFQIFKPFNLPIPVNLNSSDDHSFSMLAYLNLEAKAIGVNVQKTKYILLNDERLDECIRPDVNFCDIRSPIYRINLSKLCIIALFMKDNVLIKENCKNIIKLNALSPMAEYLSDGTWVVVTNTPLRMTIVCESISNNKEIIIKPPVDLLKLKTSCSANNDRLSLLPFYNIETQLNIDEPFERFIKNYNWTYSNTWNDFHKSVPNFTYNKLPKALSAIENIPMDSLISELNKVKEISIDEPEPLIPSWVSIIIAIFIISLIIFICCLGKRFKRWLNINLEKTRQTSASPDELVDAGCTRGVDAAEKRSNTFSPSANRISRSSQSSQPYVMEPLVKSRLIFKELMDQSKKLKRFPTTMNIPETIKELEEEDDI